MERKASYWLVTLSSGPAPMVATLNVQLCPLLTLLSNQRSESRDLIAMNRSEATSGVHRKIENFGIGSI